MISYEESAAEIAVRTGSKATLENLIEANPQILQDHWPTTLLHYALLCEQVHIFSMLLPHHSSIVINRDHNDENEIVALALQKNVVDDIFLALCTYRPHDIYGQSRDSWLLSMDASDSK